MIPEIGHFALIIALSIAIIQGTLPLLGVWLDRPAWIGVAVPAARAQVLFLAISFICLTYAFLVDDFSVAYVATNSNTAQPLMYKISAVWGAHEGSLLLWVLMLGIWGLAITLFSRSVPEVFTARVLAVIGLVGVGFLLFTLGTSNPFERLFPAPLQGRELNPLLQDPGLAIHPPMLYLGYVGMVVPFAFAIAALLEGRLDSAWVRWTRPWTNVAWMFLTFGIALGSWWAYYELGWGGWWFWDPVENASFMPWLVATALIHSLAVTEKRGSFRSWTVLLSIFAFSLSLLGTFLVRSGVLVSVHAFATDPARGMYILIFLCVVIGSSLLLFAWRAAAVSASARFEWVSKDTFLLLNNILLTVAAASVLIGTLYPLFLDALGLGKISVGPPYFNTVFVPLMLPLLLLMGIGPLARWKKDTPARLARLNRFTLPAAIVLASVTLGLVGKLSDIMVWLGLFAAFWIVVTALYGVRRQMGGKGMRGLSLGFGGMTVAHTGMAVFVVGVTLTSAYSIEQDVRMAPGDSLEVKDYRFQFEGVAPHRGANYRSTMGTMDVYEGGERVTTLYPEKRYYASQENPMTEAAIDAGVTRDLYVALGEPVGSGAWAVRVYHKPFIQWIWFGCLMMGIGGLLASFDRRYRLARRVVRAGGAGATPRPMAGIAEGAGG
ncbi:MAG: heme lyase CcmF/NrfE family subunit [Gammaproteobacteria bacterium]|nr:heme lyase CcmF/NrfE family subunit [Gammaproteobacteria bacterium]